MAGLRDVWVRAALIVSLLLPIYFMAAAFGAKFGVFDWTVGFGLLTLTWGVRVLLGAAAFAVVAVLLALLVAPRRGALAALIALIVPLCGVGYGLYVRVQAQDIPPIHDLSTDLDDPPSFSLAVIEARAAIPQSNGLDLAAKRTGDGRSYAEVQREGYPDITHISTGLAPNLVWEMARVLAQEQGLRIGHADVGSGVIEATEATFWYGFTDDIVIRVRSEGTGARVDMRSVSRVGVSDLGANAARMRPYLRELRTRIEHEESR